MSLNESEGVVVKLKVHDSEKKIKTSMTQYYTGLVHEQTRLHQFARSLLYNATAGGALW